MDYISFKKGKGQISYKQKARLYKIGETEMLRAISRYKDELEKISGERHKMEAHF